MINSNYPNLNLALATIVLTGWASLIAQSLAAQATDPTTPVASAKISCADSSPDDQEPRVDETRLPNGRSIQPAGEVMPFSGRPVDIKLSPDGHWLLVKDRDSLKVIDAKQWKLVQSIASPDGASLWGIAVGRDNRVYFTNAKSELHVYAISDRAEENNPYKLEKTITLANGSFPCGIKLSSDELTAYVCLSKSNSVAVVDLTTGKTTRTFDVGIAPFDLVLCGETLFVSNIGGRRAVSDDKTAPSAGTETVVDERGIANTGTVSLIDLRTNTVTESIAVELHPSVMAAGLNATSVVVCNTNDDSISLVNSKTHQATTLVVKPDEKLPFGSMPSAIHLLVEQKLYVVALAGNNAVAIVDPTAALVPDAKTSPADIRGLIPTAWYPVSIDSDSEYLYVACVKGLGSRSIVRPEKEGRNSHDAMGTVQRIPLTQIFQADQLRKWTETVHEVSKVKQILLAAELPPSQAADHPPIPIPEQLGQPSLLRHVIYVIKENRTFDQVFGDVAEARSEPELCIFPEKITPNHHALARRFGILDNYYCNGVLSADGHSWATEGNVTPYLERAFGGFARSYSFGDDPITYSSSGFLWDHILAAGLSFRNFGEMDYATPPNGMEYQAIWEAYTNDRPIEFKQNIGIERLRRYSSRDYPGWNMVIPDVLRMDRFLNEFREFEKNGTLPNLTIVYLPQDHLGGGVTSEAHMADNDLAIGRLVAAVSNSKFWKETAIIINEDDPQNGYDHIDGHRSLCLVVSPYSRPGVNSNFYNQTSVLRTILHIFGLPPMNQQDASMPLMSDCFQPIADLTPYTAVDANVPLNQAGGYVEEQSSAERQWRTILATVPIERTGLKTETDEDNLNRFVWHEVRGWDVPYPAEWVGPHARGLTKLGLKLDPTDKD